MDFATVISAVSAVGFPIVMCVLLFWYIKAQDDSHKEESNKFTEALNRNTIVLQKLCDRLGVSNDDK